MKTHPYVALCLVLVAKQFAPGGLKSADPPVKAINCLAVSPDHSLVVTGGADNAVVFWDARTLRRIGAVTASVQPIESIAFSPDGRTVVAGTWRDVLNDGVLLVMDAKTRLLKQKIITKDAGVVHHVTFSPDGKALAVSGLHIMLLNTGTWKVSRTMPQDSWASPTAFSPDGKLLAMKAPESADVLVRSVSTGAIVHTCQGHWDGITGMAFSPDGYTLAVCSNDASTKFWDTRSWKEEATLNQTLPVESVSYSANGTCATASDDGTIKVTRQGVEGNTIFASVTCLSFLNDRTLVGAGKDGSLHRWDIALTYRPPVKAAEPTTGLMASRAWTIAFTRDGNIWLANGDGTHQRLVIRHGDAPCWSADKGQIAFEREGNVWVAGADGSHARRLTSWKPVSDYSEDEGPGSSDVSIAWSSRDPFVIYSHNETFRYKREVGIRGHTNSGSISADSLFLAPLDPSKRPDDPIAYDLTDSGGGFNFTNYAHPSFDRTGKKLAFACNGDVWMAQRGEERFGLSSKDFSSSCWESSRIASPADFDNANDRADREIHVATHFSWSPSGNQLACGVQRVGGSGFYDIHILTVRTNPNLSARENVEDRTLGVEGIQPAFSPDGKWIAFLGDGPDGNGISGISEVSLDGKSHRRLIEDASEPTW